MTLVTDTSAKASFLDIYHEHLDAVYNFIAWRTRNRVDAEDITSHVFLKAYEKYAGFSPRPGISVKNWLFMIARNTVIDFYRAAKHAPAVPLDETATENIPWKKTLPDTVFDHQQLIADAKKIINALPKKQKETVTLRLFGGLSNKEIAEILKISEKTVASNYVRGLRKVSTALHNFL